MTKRYILYPGFVRSANDGDRHYIGAPVLARLYGVPLRECIIANHESHTRGLRGTYTHLYPRTDGNYSLER